MRIRFLPAVRPSALLATLLLVGGLVFALPGTVFACSCVPHPPLEVAIEQSDAVFTGTVTSSGLPGGGDVMSSVEPVTYTFAVDRVVAGDVGSTVEVTTAAMEVSCGIEFREGTRYVVFATNSEGNLETNLCTPTEQINATTGVFPPGKTSEIKATPTEVALNSTTESDEGTSVWPWVAVGGVAAAALGLVLMRRLETRPRASR